MSIQLLNLMSLVLSVFIWFHNSWSAHGYQKRCIQTLPAEKGSQLFLHTKLGWPRSLPALSAEENYTSPSYPSITTYTWGKCRGILGWNHQSLKMPMQRWNESSQLTSQFFFFFFYFPLLQEPCFNSFHALVFLNDKPNAHFCLSRSPASAESLNATTSAKPSQPPAVSAKHHPCLAGQAYSYTSWLALRGFKLWQVNRPFVLVTWVDVVAIIVNLSFWIVQVCSSNPNVPLPSFNILKWVFSWKFSWLIPWVNGPRVLFDFL